MKVRRKVFRPEGGKILQVDKDNCNMPMLITCTLHQLFSRFISFPGSGRNISLLQIVQTCSELHLASYTTLTKIISPGMKRPVR